MKELIRTITQLRHELHAHPELSMNETWTKERLMRFVKEHTKLEVVDRGHWFYACYRCDAPKKPAIALRADFDAVAINEESDIPYRSQYRGVGHQCGHDGHSSILAGLTMEVEKRGADRDVYFIFQHAEEIGAGGAQCASLIEEKGISAVYAFHNMSGFEEGSVVVKDGVIQCASKGLTIIFKGKNSHACAPEEGINPAPAIAGMILYLQEALRDNNYRGMVLGTIVHAQIGTKDFGISAGRGELSVTLRGLYEDEMDDLEAGLRRRAEDLAREYGMQVRFEISDPFPATVNDEGCNEVIRKAAAQLSLPQRELAEPYRASEDFGYYQKRCPGAIFFIGNGEEYAPIHTAKYDFNDKIIKTALEMELAIIRS